MLRINCSKSTSVLWATSSKQISKIFFSVFALVYLTMLRQLKSMFSLKESPLCMILLILRLSSLFCWFLELNSILFIVQNLLNFSRKLPQKQLTIRTMIPPIITSKQWISYWINVFSTETTNVNARNVNGKKDI